MAPPAATRVELRAASPNTTTTPDPYERGRADAVRLRTAAGLETPPVDPATLRALAAILDAKPREPRP